MITISDEVFPYLVLQKGELYWLNGDRQLWERAYAEDIQGIFNNIEPCLPTACHSILDVGGGMAGINILLARHYGSPLVAVLDGESDPPQMHRHAWTFNDLGVTGRFLAANGVDNFLPIPANKLPDPRPFNLITSYGSWCFHYAPGVYLDWVKACCLPTTTLILDVRTIHPDWLETLENTFHRVGFIDHGNKHDRYVFRGLK